MTHRASVPEVAPLRPPIVRRHLRAGTVIVRCSPTSIQVGTDERWAVRLTGIDDHEVQWLQAIAAGSMFSTALYRAHDVAEHRARQLWETLDAAGFVVVHTPPDASRRHISDCYTLGHLRTDGRGELTLSERSRRSVGVCGLGPLGLGIARVLLAAGIGTVVLDDAQPVTRLDVGSSAYLPHHVGMPRHEAAREVLGLPPQSASDHIPRPDVIVIVETWAHDLRRSARLGAEDVPHLAVLVREADIAVGPFVLSGQTPCLRCLELDRRDEDPAWADISRGLRALPPGRTGEETILAASGAALAAGQVIAAIDGNRPRTAGAVVTIRLPDAIPRVRETAPHPGCGCGADGHVPGTPSRQVHGVGNHAAPVSIAS